VISFNLKDGKSLIIHGDFSFSSDKKGNLILSPILSDNISNLDEIHKVVSKRLSEPTLESLYKEDEEKIAIDNSPAKSITLAEIQAEEEARKIFEDLINTWAVNFNQEGEQPDRLQLFQDTMMYNSSKIIKLIKRRNGLTRSIFQVLEKPYSEKERKKLSREIAENIVQLSAFVCPPIGELLEYPPPF
jgi:hypothetical protein